MYGRKWNTARLAYLSRHSTCVNIGQRGCTGTATCVDHIADHKGSAAAFCNRKNWQPMCAHCHNSKTAKTQLRLPPKLRYDVHGEPLDKSHHWTEESRQ
jgi:5-methylcytosine-specific restriction endonuclease McrA